MSVCDEMDLLLDLDEMTDEEADRICREAGIDVEAETARVMRMIEERFPEGGDR